MTATKTKAADTLPPISVDELADDATRTVTDAYAWLSTHWLQIVIAIAVGTLIVLVLGGLRSLGVKLCREERAGTWREVIGRVVAQTRGWFMIALAAQLVTGYADPPQTMVSTIGFLFTVAAAIQGALWAREAILGAVEHRAGGDLEHGSIGSALNIIRLLVTVILFAIATLMILDNVGVNVTGLVAGLGIGGIAIGLAAQGIFADLFAALAILFDRPFRKGDSISWDNSSGSVETIGLKSTRVRSITGEEVIISNKNLLDKELRNLARLDRRRRVFTLGVAYETSVDLLEAIPDMVKQVVEDTPKCTLVRCAFTGFGASTLDFRAEIDIHSQSYDEVFALSGRVGIGVLKAFNARGIVLAYPTQTTYTAAPDGTLVMPYHDAAHDRGAPPPLVPGQQA